MIWRRQQRNGSADESDLARRAQQGDTEAFAALVRHHQDRIYRLAWRVVGHDAAEDVAQQAFLKAWQGLGHFQGASSFGTWLYRLAMSCCLDQLRHTRRFQPLPLEAVEPSLPRDEDVGETVVEELDQAARRDALAWALERLPSEDRLLLHLRVREGLSYERMAELLEIQPATVGTRLFRVRARLHRLIVERLKEGTHEVR